MSREDAIVAVKEALGEGGIQIADDKAGKIADALNEKGELSVEEMDQVAGGLAAWDNLTDKQKKAVKIGGAAVAALAVTGGGVLAWHKDVGGVKTMWNNRDKEWVPPVPAKPGRFWGEYAAKPGYYKERKN